MSRSRRIWLGSFTAALALILVALNARTTKNALRAAIVEAAASRLDADVRIGRLDYRLWRGQFLLSEVHLSPVDGGYELDIAQLSAQWIPFWGTSISLSGPRLTLHLAPGSGSSQAEISLEIPSTISRLHIDGGALLVCEEDEPPWLELASIGGSIAHGGGSDYQGQLRTAAGTLRLAEDRKHSIALGPARARFELDRRGRIQIEQVQVEKGDSRVELQGTVNSLAPFLAELELEMDADAAVVNEMEPAWGLSGRIRGAASAVAAEQGLQVEGTLRARGLGSQLFGSWDGDARFALADESLEVQRLALSGYGGAFEAAGRIDFQSDTQRLRARFDGLDLASLSRIWADDAIPVASRASGNLDVHLRAWSLETLEGKALFDLRHDIDRSGIPLGGAVAISASGGDIQFESERITFPDGELTVRGTLRSNGDTDTRYTMRLGELGRLDSIRKSLRLPEPPLAVRGALSLNGRTTGSLDDLSSLSSELELSSDNLVLGKESFALDATLRLTASRIGLETLSLVQRQGGRLSVRGTIPLPTGSLSLLGDMESFDISDLGGLYEVPVQGTAQASFELSGPAGDPDLQATIRLSSLRWNETTGEAALRLQKEGRWLHLQHLEARWSDGVGRAGGKYQLDTEELAARIEVSRLPINDVISGFVEMNPNERLEGIISWTADVEGSLRAPTVRSRLSLENLAFRQVSLPSLAMDIRSDGAMARATLELPDGRQLATSECGLAHPYPTHVSIDLSVLPLEKVLEALAPSTPPDTRLLARGRVDLSFHLLDPRKLRYEAMVDQLAGRYRGIGGGTGAPFSIEGDLDSFRIEELHLVGTSTAISLQGRVPLTSEGVIDVSANGNARLELLQALVEDIELEGDAGLELHIAGTRLQPMLEGELRVDGATATWEGFQAREMTLVLTASGNQARVQQFSGSALGGTFRVSGELPLPRPGAGRPARVDFEMEGLDLGELVPEDYRQRTAIQLSVRGSVEAPSFEPSSFRGSGELSAVRVGLGSLEIRNDEPAPWSLRDQLLVLPRLHVTGTHTDLEVGLEARWAEDRWWKASLKGRLDNALVNPLLPGSGDVILTGSTDIHVTLDGSEPLPLLTGKGSLNDGELVLREPPLVFTNLDGEVLFSGHRIELTQLNADVGGGAVAGKGGLELSGWTEPGNASFQMDIDSVRLNYPRGMRSEVSGAFRLSGRYEELLLSGDLRLLRSSFSRNMSLESELMSSLEREARVVSEEEELSEKIRLDLTVSTVDDLRIDNNIAELEADASLKVTGTLAAPLVDGLVRAKPDGTFRLARNVYRIETGSIVLRGYPAEAPELNVTARTTVGGADIVLDLRGRPETLTVDLRAPDRPELSRADIASLLVTGRTLQNVSDFETVSGQEQRILGEQLATYLGGTLANLAQQGLGEAFRFDQISVMPSQLGSEVSPELRFTLGKAITDDLFLTYSVGLENTQKQLWILDYRLPYRLQLRGTRQEDNTLAGGVSQKLLFNLPGDPRPKPQKPEARRVGSLRITGAPPSLEERLAETVHIEAGDKYDYWKAQENADRLQRELRQNGYLGATVDLVTQTAGGLEMALEYRVSPGKPIRILWEGDELGKEIRESIERAWDGRVPESFLLSDLASRAENELERSGFYTARVLATAEDAPDGSRAVTFQVHKGPQGRGVSLEFEGNRALTERELRAALPSTSSSQFFELIESQNGRLQSLIRMTYVSIGFLEARVGEPRVEYRHETGELHVTISLEEGSQAKVTEVALEGVESLDENELRPELRMIVGLPFRLSDYRRDRTTLMSIYREKGFPEARVRGRLDLTQEGLRVAYGLQEGPRVVTGEIRVVGNHSTDRSLILKETTLKRGEPMSIPELTETQRRLYELGVFRSVDVRMGPVSQGTVERDVVIDVAESSDLDFNYGIRASSENKLDVLTELRAPNVFGRAHHAGLTVRYSDEDKLVRGTYHIPYFWRYRLATDLIVSREAKEEEMFRETFWSFTFQQQRKLTDKLDVQWSYTYKRTDSIGESTGPFPAVFLISQSILSSSLIEDRRDSIIRPTSGRFWTLTFQLAPETLGTDPEVRFFKLFGQLFYFRSLGRGLVWASGYRVGVVGDHPLPDDRFTAGGANTVRGFEQDTLGPFDRETNENFGGKAVVIYNQELRIPLYKWFRGVVFYDAGNVFAEASGLRPFDLRHSAGAGLRLELPFGLLRFDYAWVLDRQPGEKPSQYWFSLNHAF